MRHARDLRWDLDAAVPLWLRCSGIVAGGAILAVGAPVVVDTRGVDIAWGAVAFVTLLAGTFVLAAATAAILGAI